MKMASFACLFLLLFAIAACGKSEKQLKEEARQRETKVRMEAEKKLAEEARLQAEAEKKAIEEKIEGYKQQLLRVLKDPESAQFRNLRLSSGEGGEALCGEVNAKNAFGGYVGFTPFAITEQMDRQGNNVVIFPPGGDTLSTMAAKIGLKNAGCEIL